LFRHAEALKGRLQSPLDPANARADALPANARVAAFAVLGTSPAGSPVATPPCDPAVPRINKEDQQNLWGVAFLGACERFAQPPERVWLRGPSPIDLQKRVALSEPGCVAYSES